MSLPRWLMITGIVIIVVGFLSCGIGIGQELTEPKPSGTATPTPTQRPEPRTDFDLIPVSAVPAAEVAASCKLDGTTTFTGICKLTVQPSGFFPRELRLFVNAGSVAVAITQTIRGDSHTSDQKIYPGATLRPTSTPSTKIRVSGSPVDVWLNCQIGPDCAVSVIE